RGGAAEHRIAVGKTAETADDVGMVLREGETFLVAGRADQGHAALLVGEIFRMLEGKIEKTPPRHRILLIETAFDRPRRDRPGKRVGRKGARIAAEQVAGELIENEEQRERARGGRFPGGQLSR